MPPLAAILAFFIGIPLDSLVEGFPKLIHSPCRHGDLFGTRLCRGKRAWIAGLAQPSSHTAQLGDPCSEPGDCKVPNSECVQTDNLYWNRQNFCVCQAGFHPSTGFCVADSGTETGIVKLDYNGQQRTTTSTTPSFSGETTRNSSVRSLIMTPAPPGNILQGFHFGNRTQTIVSNLVEQLTHLRGQEKTDLMKDRLETLGLPLLQPAQSLARENADETTTDANMAVTDSNGYYLEAATFPSAIGAGAFVSPTTTTTTTSPSTQVISTPSTTTTTTPTPVANFNPFAMKPPPTQPPRGGTSMATTQSTSQPSPTMATILTHRPPSSSDNNSPFLPPALPPFFTKPSPLKATTSTTSTTTTTIPLFNNMTTSPSPTAAPPNPADDPEARLALLKKVQNLIVKTSPLTQRPAPTQDSTTPLNLMIPIPATIPAGTMASKIIPTSPQSSSPQTTTAASEPAPAPPVLPPPPPPVPHPTGHKAHHNNIHYPSMNGAGMKNMMNNLGMGKMPPIPVDMPLKQEIPPRPTQASPQQPTSESESQQQVRSTVVDHLPNVDFYAVFRSAAENVIREYLGGIMTTTTAPLPFAQMGQPHGILDLLHGSGSDTHAGPGMIDGHIEKLLEKMVDKTGPGGIMLQVNNHPSNHHPHHSHGPHQGVPTAPSLPQTSPNRPPSPLPNMAKTSASGGATMSTPSGTRRHPFAWSSTSRPHPAHPLPRIVFTGR